MNETVRAVFHFCLCPKHRTAADVAVHNASLTEQAVFLAIQAKLTNRINMSASTGGVSSSQKSSSSPLGGTKSIGLSPLSPGATFSPGISSSGLSFSPDSGFKHFRPQRRRKPTTPPSVITRGAVPVVAAGGNIGQMSSSLGQRAYFVLSKMSII